MKIRGEDETELLGDLRGVLTTGLEMSSTRFSHVAEDLSPTCIKNIPSHR